MHEFALASHHSSQELMNEPRCRGCAASLQAWIEEMSEFLAVHDPNHMRTVGEEGVWPVKPAFLCNQGSGRITGFFSAGARGASANPAGWASFTGQDFVRNHGGKHITHCACHAWPQNWAIAGGISGLLVRAAALSCD